MQAKTKRVVRTFLLVIVLLVCLGITYWFLAQPPTVRFPDGTVVQLTGAKVGYTNVFLRGNMLEELLGGWINSNGWKFWKWSLRTPEIESFRWWTNAEHLAVEFKITMPTNQAAASNPFASTRFDRNFGILHWGDDGFKYTEEFPDYYFKTRRDGFYGYFQTTTFARISPRLHIEFQHRESREAEWRSLARFSFRNPKLSAVQNWPVQSAPVAQTFGDFTATLGTIQVQQPRDNATPYRDIWQHAVTIPFRFSLAGQAATNWSPHEIEVYDASGNHVGYGAFKSHTNGWKVYRLWRSATPTVPWRVRGHFAQEADFAASNSFTIRLPLSLANPIVTNFGGLEVTLGFRRRDERIWGNIPQTTKGQRIILVDVFNEEGESVVKGWSGGEQQHESGKGVYTSKANITATVAIVRDIEFDSLHSRSSWSNSLHLQRRYWGRYLNDLRYCLKSLQTTFIESCSRREVRGGLGTFAFP